MKSNSSSLVVTVLAAGAMFISALSASNAQTLQTAPVNPEFVQYQQELAQKAFAPKTVSEYSRGYVPSPIDRSYLTGRTPTGIRALQALPASYDLRTLGKLTPVRDQGTNGTCWAFATYGSLESALLTAEQRDFSENNLANLHGFDFRYNSGGNYDMSTAYLARWTGPINEVDDPYANSPSSISPSNLPPQKHVQEVLVLAAKTNPLDNTAIKQAVMNSGAVYVSMYSDFDTNLYYNSANYSFYYNGVTNSDHAVAIVGWDDDYAASNFKQTPPGNGAFIVRNSWGMNWGDHGYFYCSYYDSNMCFRASAVFNNCESVANYGSVYQYDPLGWVGSVGYGSANAWVADIFTATNNEPLRAVGFYTTDIDVNYAIYIYGNITAGSPTNGTLKLTQTGSIPQSGYHTVALNTPVNLPCGQLFSVVIKFIHSSAHANPIAYEYALAGYSSRATASPGQSYVSPDGTSWNDLITYYPTANVCIKAFCGTGSVAVVSLADFAMVDASTGVWRLWLSGSGYQPLDPIPLGVSGTPVAADFDNDGKADFAMVSSTGVWRLWFSGSGYQPLDPVPLNVSGTPVAADFDGDGFADFAMVSGTGVWRIWFSGLGYQMLDPIPLNVSGTPVAADFDNDGLADFAMVSGTGVWRLWLSGSGYQMLDPIPLNVSGTPVAADFDGDGFADFAMVSGTGVWRIWFSTLGYQMLDPIPLNVSGTPVAADFN